MRKRALDAPLLHFLILGLVLYLASGWIGGSGVETIYLDEAKIEALVGDYRVTRGRMPSVVEQRALVRAALDEEILYREALRHGLDSAPAVQQRLGQLAAFLELGAQGKGDAGSSRLAAVENVRALGLDRTDPAVRAYLVESMRALLRRQLEVERPSELELERYYQANLASYRQPRRVSLAHVFFAGHEVNSRERALATAAQIHASGTSAEEAIALGDVFYGGHRLAMRSRAELASTLGSEAADAVFDLPGGRWSQPIYSVYGVHLVWVHEVQEERVRDFAEVRAQVRRAVIREREEGAWGRAMEELREDRALVAGLSQGVSLSQD